jgi:hypothetical protein
MLNVCTVLVPRLTAGLMGSTVALLAFARNRVEPADTEARVVSFSRASRADDVRGLVVQLLERRYAAS